MSAPESGSMPEPDRPPDEALLAEMAKRGAFNHARMAKARRMGREDGDLERLMASIDFEATMARLGLEMRHAGGDEWVGYCPDHLERTGHPQSEPKWYVNARTGQTYCFTEHRGSNLVRAAQYIWRLDSYAAAYAALLDGRALAIPEMPWKAAQRAKERDASEAARLTKSLQNAAPLLEEGRLTPRCLAYFAQYGITELTLRKYGVASADRGYFGGRAVVPFLNAELSPVGYVAINLLGKDEWVERALARQRKIAQIPDEDAFRAEAAKAYRKTLYAPGFLGRKHLYGFYEDLWFLEPPPKELVLVEGEKDCLKLKQEKIPCLSVHGTSIKDEQLLLLKDTGVLANLDALYLGFDMDPAGDKACRDAYARFAEEMPAEKIYVLEFPGGKDPKWLSGDTMREAMRTARETQCRRRPERQDFS